MMTSARTLRHFGIGMSVILGGISGYWWVSPFLAGTLASLWIGGSCWRPRWNAPFYHAWMRFAEIWGFWNTRLLLTVIFYGTCLPIGLLRRLFRPDPLHQRWAPEQTTYRVSSTVPLPQHLERPF